VGAEQNVATVKAMYEAFGRRDVEAILERVTDDVDWSTGAAMKSRRRTALAEARKESAGSLRRSDRRDP